MTQDRPISLGRLVAGIGLFVLVGFPLVGYLWETLNQLMAGDVRPARLAVSLPLLLLFALLLYLLSRSVRGWESARAAGHAHRHPD